jgi:group II intron reverse transcriptase/maturase
VETKFNQIAEKAKLNPNFVFNSLAHLLTTGLLQESFESLRKKAAVGLDEVSYADYETNMYNNIRELHQKLISRTYQASPLKRVWIDKGNGKQRPLGIANIEDKIVQRAVTTLLNLVYEQDFYNFSYGFREEHSAHQALDYFRTQSMRRRIKHFINADIKGCFDNFDHKILLDILNKRVNDGGLNWLINQWLKTEIIDGKQMTINDKGTPQGGIISPLLANVYLHEVIDKWIIQEIKPLLKGEVFIVRYADDFIIGLENQSDAERLYEVLPKRLSKYSLELSMEKSRLQNFVPENKERNNTIDFLGFTHYWTKSRAGNYIIKRRTRNKSKVRVVKELYELIKANRHKKLKEQQEAIKSKLQGTYGYYAIRGNYQFLHLIYEKARLFWYKMLNHRGGRKKSYSSDAFIELLRIFVLPRPRILHNI